MKTENKSYQEAIEILKSIPKFKDNAEMSKAMREAPDTLNADDIAFINNQENFQ